MRLAAKRAEEELKFLGDGADVWCSLNSLEYSLTLQILMPMGWRIVTGRHDYTVKKALTIDSIRLGVPSLSHLFAFVVFQALIHVVFVRITKCLIHCRQSLEVSTHALV